MCRDPSGYIKNEDLILQEFAEQSDALRGRINSHDSSNETREIVKSVQQAAANLLGVMSSIDEKTVLSAGEKAKQLWDALYGLISQGSETVNQDMKQEVVELGEDLFGIHKAAVERAISRSLEKASKN